MKTIRPIKLTPTTFKPYGYVINATKGRPLAKNRELTYWSKVSLFEMGKVVSTGVMFGHKRKPVLRSLERHARTPEVLVALEGDSVICFGERSPDGDEIQGVKAFYVRQGDAICMHTGTWHWTGFPLNVKECEFLVLFAIDTETSDLEIRSLPEEIEITLRQGEGLSHS